jgi:hypothetical protein
VDVPAALAWRDFMVSNHTDQATLAVPARVPLSVLRDVIQPFPTFSEIYVAALKALRGRIAAAPR